MKKPVMDFNMKTKEEARQKAIEWQSWQNEQAFSLCQVIAWENYFRIIGKRFNLIREFKENCIL
jgi:hypothetical protein